MRLLLIPVLGLSVLGCAGLIRSEDSVRDDIRRHLEQTHGEDFTITKVSGQTMSGGRFHDKYNYGAYPNSDPTLSFVGTADYDARPNKVNDDYACRLVERWLPDRVLADLGDAHRFDSVKVLCSFRNLLPPHPKPNEPLTPKIVSMRMQIEVFTDGDPAEAAAATRTAVFDITNALNVHPRGKIRVYPKAIWPFVQGWTATEGTFAPSAEGWTALAMGEAWIDYPDRAPTVYEPSPALEAQVAEVLAAVRPDALATSIRSRRDDQSPNNERYLLDVRIADDKLDLQTMRAIAARLPSLEDKAMWELRGVDRAGPGEPQRKGFVCVRRRCEEVQDALIDPAVFAP